MDKEFRYWLNCRTVEGTSTFDECLKSFCRQVRQPISEELTRELTWQLEHRGLLEYFGTVAVKPI